MALMLGREWQYMLVPLFPCGNLLCCQHLRTGLIRGEEIHAVQHNVSHKLELLHQQRLPKAWSAVAPQSATSAGSLLQQDEPVVQRASSMKLGGLPVPPASPAHSGAAAAAGLGRGSFAGPSSTAQQSGSYTASVNVDSGLEFLAPLRTGSAVPLAKLSRRSLPRSLLYQ